MGGIGIRRIADIMLPAFLSSVTSTSSLVISILSVTTTDLVEATFYDEAIAIWNSMDNVSPLNETATQSQWDKVNTTRITSSLQFKTDIHIALFKASREPESSLWLSVLPSKNIGTLLDDNTFRISMALRLGADMFHEHFCACGALVDKSRIHGLCCKKNIAKYAKHRKNNIIHRALNSANVPAKLEPTGLFRDDGKRLDGIALIPWEKGSCLAWDATCVVVYQHI